MHAFLHPDPPDLPKNPDTLHIHPDPSIGISEVRHIQSFLSQKPLQSDHNTVVIHDAHLLTLPAQHAFLKTLEEPPGKSEIYLITAHPDQLLPTILSRVQIVNRSQPSHPSYPSYLPALLSATGVGDRLKILSDHASTREELTKLLDSLELHLHNQINSGTYNLQPTTYNPIADTRRYLKANCNLKLLLNHLSLHLTKTP